MEVGLVLLGAAITLVTTIVTETVRHHLVAQERSRQEFVAFQLEHLIEVQRRLADMQSGLLAAKRHHARHGWTFDYPLEALEESGRSYNEGLTELAFHLSFVDNEGIRQVASEQTLMVHRTYTTVGQEQFAHALAETTSSYLALQQQIGTVVIQHRRPAMPRRWWFRRMADG